MNDEEIRKTIREIKTLVEEIDMKMEFLIEKMSEMIYRR
jgi:hypothetical protein